MILLLLSCYVCARHKRGVTAWAGPDQAVTRGLAQAAGPCFTSRRGVLLEEPTSSWQWLVTWHWQLASLEARAASFELTAWAICRAAPPGSVKGTRGTEFKLLICCHAKRRCGTGRLRGCGPGPGPGRCSKFRKFRNEIKLHNVGNSHLSPLSTPILNCNLKLQKIYVDYFGCKI